MNRFKDNKSEKLTMYSAIFSLNYYKGFSVIRSSNLDETAYIICNAIMKIKKEKDKKPFFNNKNISCDTDNITDKEEKSNWKDSNPRP